ncbi:MAG TPA: hypothetical protein VFI01_05380 [Gaiellaceae bacterium]|nr:hypothetical protein [Gaiellaceae bacterium]
MRSSAAAAPGLAERRRSRASPARSSGDALGAIAVTSRRAHSRSTDSISLALASGRGARG